MTNNIQKRAVHALLSCKCSSGKCFPEIYVIGDKIAFFRNQARRIAHSGKTPMIEIIEFNTAYMKRYGNYPTEQQIDENVDFEIGQEGELFNGKLYNEQWKQH